MSEPLDYTYDAEETADRDADRDADREAPDA